MCLPTCNVPNDATGRDVRPWTAETGRHTAVFYPNDEHVSIYHGRKVVDTVPVEFNGAPGFGELYKLLTGWIANR